MKLEVSGIKVLRGEWQVLPPEDTGLNPPQQQESALLIVAAQFGIMDSKGSMIATGQISNSPATGTNTLQLSESTLEAFQAFFSGLEHDIANGLETGDDKRAKLAKILAGELPR